MKIFCFCCFDNKVTALEKHGTDFNKLVEAKKDKIRNDSNAKTMSDEELTYLADAEVIADSCETMLKDSKIFEDIAQGNPTLAQKIKAKLKNFIERLKQLLKKTDALTYEGKLLEECISELKNIQKLWDKAVTSGIKTTNAINAKQKNNTADNGVKYSIRDNFYKEYDNWDKKNTRIVFNIGTTSKVLQSIGLSKQKITWDSSKIIKIKAKHTEMTDSIIKQVPDIIENPIVIMKSKSQDSRITLFGEVFSNNKPILVIIELSPQNKKGIILNELKIASAYGKDNAQNLINTSSVLYIESNKKRVRNWEKRTGLQLPVGSSLSNSNNIISTSTANVNKNKKISMRNSAYLEAVENNDLETAQRLVEEAAKESGYTINSADSVTYDDNGNVIPLSERFNEAKSDIRYQSRSTKRKYAKHGGIFSDSLTSDEWAKFTNAMTTGIDAGLRISDNAILVECEEKSDYQYKLVIYDNEIEDNPLKSVYAIGNIDYNKTTANEIAYFNKKLEDKGYDSKKIFTKLLRNHTKEFGYVLGRYSIKSKQYANIGQGIIKDQGNTEIESDRGRIAENTGKRVSDSRVNDNVDTSAALEESLQESDDYSKLFLITERCSQGFKKLAESSVEEEEIAQRAEERN